MKIINPSVELITQQPGHIGMLRHIELCARTCYKSEVSTTDEECSKFVNNLIESGHTAMLEHGTVYLTLKLDKHNRTEIVNYTWYRDNTPVKFQEIFGYVQKVFYENPYSDINLHYDHDNDETTMAITTNFRVIVENKLDYLLPFATDYTQYHSRRITLKFITNIGVTREGNRMRANSIAEESTRYCNYTKEKFCKTLNVCRPAWSLENNECLIADSEEYYDAVIESYDNILFTDEEKKLTTKDYYIYSIQVANYCYNKLIELGWTPQQAREVLPLATKSEIIYTAYAHNWRHWFDLRLYGTTGKPHPNMEQISSLAKDILVNNNLWELIYPEDKNKS